MLGSQRIYHAFNSQKNADNMLNENVKENQNILKMTIDVIAFFEKTGMCILNA